MRPWQEGRRAQAAAPPCRLIFDSRCPAPRRLSPPHHLIGRHRLHVELVIKYFIEGYGNRIYPKSTFCIED
ncbi:hypothetical protein E2562_002031 [Oryza meyeriana var. granulata]|uniref:Uncharacterized protein n=1 Tax=Oryza meyeriana var. granulata TaxID=110450 RepID=A0A6G1C269_9ORYZ|nr:hypothetical protein E2562_002031 [Oryza meyeriana var. granulata]